MKIIVKNILTILIFFYTAISLGQTYADDETEEVSGEQIVMDDVRVSPELFASLGFQETIDRTTALQGNLVRVQQIGQGNFFNLATSTQTSDISINQEGDFNAINLEYRAQSVFANLNQVGNSNSIVDFVSDPDATPQLELEQQGNNLSFERFGTNALTESLKFKQTAASSAIIVRSYN